MREAFAITGGPEPLLSIAEVERPAAQVNVVTGQAVAEVELAAAQLQLVAGQAVAHLELPAAQLQVVAGQAVPEVEAPRPAESPNVLGRVAQLELPAAQLQVVAGQAVAELELPAAQLQVVAGQAVAEVELPAAQLQVLAGQAVAEVELPASEKPPKVRITTSCCSGSTPATVTATFSGYPAPLSDINGVPFSLSWVSANSRWEGSWTLHGNTGTASFKCGVGNQWQFAFITGGVCIGQTPGGGTCASPIAMSGTPVTIGLDNASGTLTITY